MMLMSSQNSRAGKIAMRGMLIAVAMILSWIEAQIPPFTAVPGMKLGLTNLVVLVALYRFGTKDAVVINVLRIILVGISFGNTFALVYSLAGGLLSGFAMILLKSKNFSVVSVSLAGGVFHNVGQILVAMAVLNTRAVTYYLPFLWVSGMAAGILIGLLGSRMLRYLPRQEE